MNFFIYFIAFFTLFEFYSKKCKLYLYKESRIADNLSGENYGI